MSPAQKRAAWFAALTALGLIALNLFRSHP